MRRGAELTAAATAHRSRIRCPTSIQTTRSAATSTPSCASSRVNPRLTDADTIRCSTRQTSARSSPGIPGPTLILVNTLSTCSTTARTLSAPTCVLLGSCLTQSCRRSARPTCNSLETIQSIGPTYAGPGSGGSRTLPPTRSGSPSDDYARLCVAASLRSMLMPDQRRIDRVQRSALDHWLLSSRRLRRAVSGPRATRVLRFRASRAQSRRARPLSSRCRSVGLQCNLSMPSTSVCQLAACQRPVRASTSTYNSCAPRHSGSCALLRLALP